MHGDASHTDTQRQQIVVVSQIKRNENNKRQQNTVVSQVNTHRHTSAHTIWIAYAHTKLRYATRTYIYIKCMTVWKTPKESIINKFLRPSKQQCTHNECHLKLQRATVVVCCCCCCCSMRKENRNNNNNTIQNSDGWNANVRWRRRNWCAHRILLLQLLIFKWYMGHWKLSADLLLSSFSLCMCVCVWSRLCPRVRTNELNYDCKEFSKDWTNIKNKSKSKMKKER